MHEIKYNFFNILTTLFDGNKMKSDQLPRLEMCILEHCAPNRTGRADHSGCVSPRIDSDMKVVRQ